LDMVTKPAVAENKKTTVKCVLKVASHISFKT